MSYQQIFDRAVAGLAAQGFVQCVDPSSGACVYHDPATSHRCAIGHLAPGSAPPPETWDNSGGVLEESPDSHPAVCSLVSQYPDLPRDDLVPFLADLQKTHDDVSDMVDNLKIFAVKYHLTLPDELA